MGLRDALEEQFDAAEDGTLEAPVERDIEVSNDPISQEAERNDRGQFKSREEPQDIQAAESSEPVEEAPRSNLQRPTTFKKEYLPIWEKMAAGQQLTPDESIKFAEYAGNIRENEFKKGVSTYKAEADNAKSLMEAISPFIPDLQKQNIHPAAWINNLGRAHMTLTNAPYDERVKLFHRLAADYGIQLNQPQQQEQQFQQPADPYTQQLLQQLQYVNQEVSTIKGRYEQEENTRLMSEISQVAQDVKNYPHFEEVREQMAQLLERGLATDLKTAYTKAVRLEDSVWEKEQQRMLQQSQMQSNKRQQVARAKSTAVSPRSVTPNGVVASSDKKDRRSMLDELVSSSMGGRY
jgi:hypothetical protein